jgi:predicted lipoprotein with Yx(FWY)xxD motif
VRAIGAQRSFPQASDYRAITSASCAITSASYVWVVSEREVEMSAITGKRVIAVALAAAAVGVPVASAHHAPGEDAARTITRVSVWDSASVERDRLGPKDVSLHRKKSPTPAAVRPVSPPRFVWNERSVAGDAAIVKVAFNKKLKRKILVNAQGFTLYLFTEDTRTKSACVDSYDHCPTIWPPLRSSDPPVAGRGARASLLATIARDDGDPQVTYKGHPLYTDAGSADLGIHADLRPGQIRGQGVLFSWYVVSPLGKAIRKSP